jgi:hypothetical protein
MYALCIRMAIGGELECGCGPVIVVLGVAESALVDDVHVNMAGFW